MLRTSASKKAPLRLTLDPAYLNMSAHHREAFAYLLYGNGQDHPVPALFARFRPRSTWR
jgi:hypothetical protein